jgi:hypothetical protein
MRPDLDRPDLDAADAPRRPARDRDDADTPVQKIWQWLAIAALLFCWIAEATMCADRGF